MNPYLQQILHNITTRLVAAESQVIASEKEILRLQKLIEENIKPHSTDTYDH